MSTFSEKQGFVKKLEAFQVNDMDEALKNGLWNIIHEMFLNRNETTIGMPPGFAFVRKVWARLWKLRVDDLDGWDWPSVRNKFKTKFFGGTFYQVYDVVQFAVDLYSDEPRGRQLKSYFNYVLKEEMSAYRFVGNKLARITSDEEIQEIEEAQNTASDPVAEHLTRALQLMSDRENPDHRNSIKESISAVEAQCKLMTGKHSATLGQCLKLLRENLELHPALLAGFEKLYGWTSQDDGIRHALMDQSSLQLEDSKYMLVTCSAFVNFLKEKSLNMGPG